MDHEMNNHTVIVDIGSSAVKAGLSSNENPILLVEPLIVEEKLPNVTGLLEKKTIGFAARKNHTLKLKVPVQRGEIMDFDLMVDLMEHIYANLPVKVEPNESSFIICQSPLNPKSKTEELAKLMFEKFKICNLYIGDHGKFVANALKKSHALVIECGHGVTETIPVYEDYCLLNAARRMKFGGLDINEELMRLLIETGQAFITHTYIENAQKIKEEYCKLISNDSQSSSTDCEIITTTYKSSNGEFFRIGNERFAAAQAIFDPANTVHKAIQQIVVESINVCHATIQEDIARNIIISGGTTLIGEFAEKLREELLPYRQYINIISVPNRKYLSFMGASQYSVSDTMEHLWLKKQDFDDCGPQIVHEKFF